MVDRTTKILLLAIAVGLWMNVASQWLRPVAVHAAVEQLRSSDLSDIERYLRNIDGDLGRIQRGTCINSTIC